MGESIAGMRRLFRRHYKSCPFKKEGMSYIDCDCPVHVSAYKTAEGKFVCSRSLNTRNWEKGRKLLAVLEKGAPFEAIVPKGKLYRLHSPACPHKEDGRSYIDCSCMVWTEYRENGKLIYRFSLGTRDWKEAEDRQATFEKSGSTAAIRTLYRRHAKSCPHRKEGRTSYALCTCPIWRDFYKRGQVIHSRSMHTRNWEEAERRLAAEVASNDQTATPKRGRPDKTSKVYERWVERGRQLPVTADEADALAEEFYPREFSRAKRYPQSRRKLQKRIRGIILRHTR
jgi:hypothetical protein